MQLVRVFQIRPAAATAGIEGKTEALEFEQALAIGVTQRRHHGNLRLQQGLAEIVFLADRRIRPAPGTIELGDQRLAILDAHLVDAVLITVEGQQPAIAAIAQGVHGVEHRVRSEAGVRSGRGSIHWHHRWPVRDAIG